MEQLGEAIRIVVITVRTWLQALFRSRLGLVVWASGEPGCLIANSSYYSITVCARNINTVQTVLYRAG